MTSFFLFNLLYTIQTLSDFQMYLCSKTNPDNSATVFEERKATNLDGGVSYFIQKLDDIYENICDDMNIVSWIPQKSYEILNKSFNTEE